MIIYMDINDTFYGDTFTSHQWHIYIFRFFYYFFLLFLLTDYYLWEFILVDSLVCNSIKLFSNKLTKGTIIKKCEKYNTVLICPNSMKGDSTCLAPSCINIKKFATKM